LPEKYEGGYKKMGDEHKSCGMESQTSQHQKQDQEIGERLRHIKNKILVMSGKGGVGKSSIAAYLAVALAKRGHRVGLMDVDLHGPSIPRILGLTGSIGPGTKEGKAEPIPYLPNLHVISIESLLGDNKDLATIWRGPLKIGVIKQFISDIEWGDLEYLVIDSPPGTGDEPLTVAQTIPDAQALIVTTPQEISLADVRKSINFCRQVQMRILGLVENMSGLVCPHCGQMVEIFKAHGGMLTAKKENLALLGSLPLEPEVVQMGDMGNMGVLDKDELAFTQEFDRIVEKIEARGVGSDSRPIEMHAATVAKAGRDNAKRVLAIPVSDGKLCSHFGHCDQFILIETESGKITHKQMHTPPPHEPGLLPRWLQEKGADVVIAGGIGERAKQLCTENGIEVIAGAPMDSPESLVNQYLTNTLATGENVCDH
jgi:Mrp family chromosome partitioning ATPase/predicted Fe-Mo cluster-binding NifX family protein